MSDEETNTLVRYASNGAVHKAGIGRFRIGI